MVWEQKLVVKDARQRFHRCSTATEQHDRGLKASCQVDKLQGLLKDEPMKLSLKFGKGNFHKIPALNVVQYPNIDSEYRNIQSNDKTNSQQEREVTRAFTGGPLTHRSWLLENNFIPREKDKTVQFTDKDFKYDKSIDIVYYSMAIIDCFMRRDLYFLTITLLFLYV